VAHSMKFKSAGRKLTVLPGGSEGNVTLQGMGISFSCGALTNHAGLTRVKRACVVNHPRAKEKSEAHRFHGVTDGPLFRAAAKKEIPIPWSPAHSR
jgi:hypothetical protein